MKIKLTLFDLNGSEWSKLFTIRNQRLFQLSDIDRLKVHAKKIKMISKRALSDLDSEDIKLNIDKYQLPDKRTLGINGLGYWLGWVNWSHKTFEDEQGKLKTEIKGKTSKFWLSAPILTIGILLAIWFLRGFLTFLNPITDDLNLSLLIGSGIVLLVGFASYLTHFLSVRQIFKQLTVFLKFKGIPFEFGKSLYNPYAPKDKVIEPSKQAQVAEIDKSEFGAGVPEIALANQIESEVEEAASDYAPETTDYIPETFGWIPQPEIAEDEQEIDATDDDAMQISQLEVDGTPEIYTSETAIVEGLTTDYISRASLAADELEQDKQETFVAEPEDEAGDDDWSDDYVQVADKGENLEDKTGLAEATDFSTKQAKHPESLIYDDEDEVSEIDLLFSRKNLEAGDSMLVLGKDEDDQEKDETALADYSEESDDSDLMLGTMHDDEEQETSDLDEQIVETEEPEQFESDLADFGKGALNDEDTIVDDIQQQGTDVETVQDFSKQLEPVDVLTESTSGGYSAYNPTEYDNLISTDSDSEEFSMSEELDDAIQYGDSSYLVSVQSEQEIRPELAGAKTEIGDKHQRDDGADISDMDSISAFDDKSDGTAEIGDASDLSEDFSEISKVEEVFNEGFPPILDTEPTSDSEKASDFDLADLTAVEPINAEDATAQHLTAPTQIGKTVFEDDLDDYEDSQTDESPIDALINDDEQDELSDDEEFQTEPEQFWTNINETISKDSESDDDISSDSWSGGKTFEPDPLFGFDDDSEGSAQGNDNDNEDEDDWIDEWEKTSEDD